MFTPPTCCCGIADAFTDSSNAATTSGAATLSGLLENTRATPSLAPDTTSPVSAHAATAHTEMAGCVMVCTHSSPFQTLTVLSSALLTISPDGSVASEYTKLSWPLSSATSVPLRRHSLSTPSLLALAMSAPEGCPSGSRQSARTRSGVTMVELGCTSPATPFRRSKIRMFLSADPVMMVFSSSASTAQTLTSCPVSINSVSHFPTPQTLACASHPPDTMYFPPGVTSSVQTLCACPTSSLSALSSFDALGFLTSMIVSRPPETTRPSGYSAEGGTNATELM